MRRYLAGDPLAWSELVERFSGYVYAIVGYSDLNGGRAQGVARGARDCLDEPFGEVIRRLFVADESCGAIGEARGLPLDTVASRISHGLVRRLLEAEVQPAGGGDVNA